MLSKSFLDSAFRISWQCLPTISCQHLSQLQDDLADDNRHMLLFPFSCVTRLALEVALTISIFGSSNRQSAATVTNRLCSNLPKGRKHGKASCLSLCLVRLQLSIRGPIPVGTYSSLYCCWTRNDRDEALLPSCRGSSSRVLKFVTPKLLLRRYMV